LSDQIDPTPSAPSENEYEEEVDPTPPPPPPRPNFTKHSSSHSNKSITPPLARRPVPILPLSEDEFLYSGTLNQLEQIFKDSDRPGVFAVMRKTNPDVDCLWAIRVFEHRDELISSWNIYHNTKTNKFSLCDQFESLPEFSTIEDLCLFYMKNDLPGEPVSVSRLMLPYRRL